MSAASIAKELMIGAARHCILHSFSDASFAPYSGACTCEKHAGVMDVNWVRTGSYTKELAKGILAAVRAARRAA